MTAIKGRQTHNLFSALNWAFHAPKDAIFIFFLGHRPRKFGRSGSTRMAAVFLSRGKIKKRKRVELYYGRKLEIERNSIPFPRPHSHILEGFVPGTEREVLTSIS